MKNRKLDRNGDYSFGNNLGDYITGDIALAQAIKTRILLFYKEWWEDLESGIPMFQNIIGQVNRDNLEIALQSLLAKRIREFEEVSTIEFSDIILNNRTLSMELTCTLMTGETLSINLNI